MTTRRLLLYKVELDTKVAKEREVHEEASVVIGLRGILSAAFWSAAISAALAFASTFYVLRLYGSYWMLSKLCYTVYQTLFTKQRRNELTL